MITIRHRQSGAVILELEGDTLSKAVLMGEYLIHSDLEGLDLSGTNLVCANLSGSNLKGCCLKNANLSGANLTEVDLTGADLTGAKLAGSTFSLTILNDCVGLHHAVGLERVIHANPSMINEAAFQFSMGALSNDFFRKIGLTWSEIGYYRNLYSQSDN